MRFRFRTILGVAAVALCAGEAWFIATTPWSGQGDLGVYDYSRIDFLAALRKDRELARRVGYDDATAHADWELLKSGGALSRAIDAKKQAMADAGATPEALYRHQKRAEAWAVAHRDPRLDRLPTLTRRQEQALLPRIVRQNGPLALCDHEVARAIGLDEGGRVLMVGRVKAARLRCQDETDAAHRTAVVWGGASPSAIAALDEQHRLFRRTLTKEVDRFDPAVDRRLRELGSQASYGSPGFLVRFASGHREMLALRRKAATRRDLEAEMVGALDRDQRARWDALVRG